ncbi:hypothetical protein LCGC14_1127180 [marine sediment metagenome]|uniref:Uncharacterized protein n=1 Tax=marine sediment metagenome TaxID=412755 RepID=A0A0F9M6Z4_9ZZZZ
MGWSPTGRGQGRDSVRDTLWQNAVRIDEYMDEFAYDPTKDPHVRDSLKRKPKCLQKPEEVIPATAEEIHAIFDAVDKKRKEKLK